MATLKIFAARNAFQSQIRCPQLYRFPVTQINYSTSKFKANPKKASANKYLGQEPEVVEQGYIAKFKGFFNFYKNGFKQVFSNHSEARVLLDKQKQGYQVTWREQQLVSTRMPTNPADPQREARYQEADSFWDPGGDPPGSHPLLGYSRSP